MKGCVDHQWEITEEVMEALIPAPLAQLLFRLTDRLTLHIRDQCKHKVKAGLSVF